MDPSIGTALTASDRAHLKRGYAIALTGVFFWSTTGIFISYLLKTYSLAPIALAFWRDLFVAIACGLGFAVLWPGGLRIHSDHRRFLLWYGVSLTATNGIWTYSVALNGAAVSTVLVYASPALTAIAGRVFFKERLSPIRMGAVICSLLGCALVARANDAAQWNVNAGGILVGLLSAVAFTVYSMMGKLVSRRQINPWTATLYAFAVAATILLPTALILKGVDRNGATTLGLGMHFGGWLVLLILALGPTLGGYGLYTASLGYLPTGTANLIAALEPMLTTILAYIVLHESLTTTQLIGGALIVGSVVALHREELDSLNRD
jgi:drug/metabolite transporter, DME family